LSVIWTTRARRHRREIIRYFITEAGTPRTAFRIEGEIVAHVGNLAQFPQTGRLGRILGTRELVITSTPYIAAYRIVGEDVVVLAVFHHAQRWPKRL